MTGDCHVRFCEGLGVKFPRAPLNFIEQITKNSVPRVSPGVGFLLFLYPLVSLMTVLSLHAIQTAMAPPRAALEDFPRSPFRQKLWSQGMLWRLKIPESSPTSRLNIWKPYRNRF